MDNRKIEKLLIGYSQETAQEKLEPLSQQYEKFNNIIQKLSQLACAPSDNRIDHDTAYKYRIDPPSSKSDKIDNLLSQETVAALPDLAKEVINTFIDIDTSHVEAHKALQEVCYALWPLYSRHSQTNMIGFDLQEYADFFEDLSHEERVELAHKITDEYEYWGGIS